MLYGTSCAATWEQHCCKHDNKNAAEGIRDKALHEDVKSQQHTVSIVLQAEAQ